MRTLILIVSLALTTVAWAGDMHGKKHHFDKQMFDKVDSNNDGSISVAEHEAALERMLKMRRSHFSEMDTDGDGLLTRDEAHAAREAMREKWREMHREHHENRDRGDEE